MSSTTSCTRISFTVPGQPVGKQRPRVTKYGTYTPKATVTYESMVRMAAHMAMNGSKLLKGPLRADIDVRMDIPQSWSKKRRLEAMQGLIIPSTKPDLDNVLKAILDACQGVVFHDDKQVCALQMAKTYHDAPWVEVHISALE